MPESPQTITISVDLAQLNIRALWILYGGRRNLRRARQAAERARLGHCTAPIKRNKRKGWRRA